MARKIKLTVEYDGTDFAGFQVQSQGERTVQSVLEQAVAQIADAPVTIRAAGRTDSGVHARGQVVDFDLDGRIPTERIATALNGILPADLSVRRAEEVDADFHARFSARLRTYVYLIWRSEQRSAIWGRYALWVPEELDVDVMRRAAGSMVGSRDFAAYANAGGDPGSTTVRDLVRFDVRRLKGGPLIAVTLSANGFLRSMVRNLMGALLAVGRKSEPEGRLLEVAETLDRALNPFATAPPHGLCLLRVDYPALKTPGSRLT